MITKDEFQSRMGKKYGFYVNIESTEFYRLFPYIVQEGWTKFIKDEEQAEKIFVSVINNPRVKSRWSGNRQANESRNNFEIIKNTQHSEDRRMDSDPNFGFGRDHE
jgi:hypothetical protein